MNELDFSGKRVLVTGGTRGIGRAISTAFARRGAEVFANYRGNEDAAKETIDAIEGAGGRAVAIRANLVHLDEIRKMLDRIGGPLDIVVHSAALGSFKSLDDLRPNQWDLTMNVNARGFFVLATEAARSMRSGSSILALSSLGSIRAIPSYGAIGISKAAIEATVRALAAELGPRGIRVNGLSAGLIEGTSVALHPQIEQISEESRRSTPLGRLGTADDLSAVVLLLSSPLAGWITGQVIIADGGLSITF